MKYIFMIPVKFYQIFISPFFGGNCRYIPTCSEYANEAFKTHGVLKGLILSILRIFSCHPFSKKCRHDPVPERFAWKDILGYKNASKTNRNNNRNACTTSEK